MRIKKIALSFIIGGAGLSTMPASACDITSLSCWADGKCNIQFKNHTGEANGDGSGTSISQVSAAQTIKVKAEKSDGSKAGNKLTIAVNASNTMNMENKYKKKFSTIQVSSTNSITDGFSMTCNTVKKILNGNGSCKIFHGTTADSSNTFVLGYNCDGGKVRGPDF